MRVIFSIVLPMFVLIGAARAEDAPRWDNVEFADGVSVDVPSEAFLGWKKRTICNYDWTRQRKCANQLERIRSLWLLFSYRVVNVASTNKDIQEEKTKLLSELASFDREYALFRFSIVPTN